MLAQQLEECRVQSTRLHEHSLALERIPADAVAGSVHSADHGRPARRCVPAIFRTVPGTVMCAGAARIGSVHAAGVHARVHERSQGPVRAGSKGESVQCGASESVDANHENAPAIRSIRGGKRADRERHEDGDPRSEQLEAE